MEEYEEQEQEFWGRLAETDMSRSQMLKRSVAAAAGLTVLSTPAAALAGRCCRAAHPNGRPHHRSGAAFAQSWICASIRASAAQ